MSEVAKFIARVFNADVLIENYIFDLDLQHTNALSAALCQRLVGMLNELPPQTTRTVLRFSSPPTFKALRQQILDFYGQDFHDVHELNRGPNFGGLCAVSKDEHRTLTYTQNHYHDDCEILFSEHIVKVNRKAS